MDDAVLDVAQLGDLEPFVQAVTDAIRAGRTTTQRLQRAARRRSKLRNRAVVEATLADLAGVESNLEWAYRRDVERAHGLPEGVRQTRVSAGTRSDVGYEHFGVLVELDGRRGHLEGAFRDMHRDNRHSELALVTLRYGSADVRGAPCAVAAQVGLALALRGWGGEFISCPRCPVVR